MKFLTKALITVGAMGCSGVMAERLAPWHNSPGKNTPAFMLIGPVVDLAVIASAPAITGVVTALILRRF